MKRCVLNLEKAHVDENYTFEDCLGDWGVVHWAIEVDAPT